MLAAGHRLEHFINMVFPNKTSYTAGQAFLIKDTTALTSSYVAGTVASFDEHNMIGLEVTYVKGDETSLQIKVESSIDNGTTYGQQVTQSASGGTTTIAPNEYSFAAASMASTQVMNILINPIKGDHIKVSFKATGGTPTGTVKIRAIFGWV